MNMELFITIIFYSVLMVNSLLLTHSTVAEAVHDSAANLEILLAAYMALRNWVLET